MQAYKASATGGLTPCAPAEAVWIDLDSPDESELAEVATETGMPLPSRADMEEIELSSRLYRSEGSDFMTLVLPAFADTERHEVAPVTFAYGGRQLVTVRYHDPRPFRSYAERAAQSPYGVGTAAEVLFGLFDEIIDRLADILEMTDARIEGVSRRLFRGTDALESPELREALVTLGQAGSLASDVRNSLVTIERAIAFLDRKEESALVPQGARALRVLSSDATSLSEHASFLTQKLGLILDAAFGMTTIEQNDVTKTFSIVAVLFLPPTLIGTVFGMNFAMMPGLDWRHGFVFSLVAMVLSSALSYLYFRWRKLL